VVKQKKITFLSEHVSNFKASRTKGVAEFVCVCVCVCERERERPMKWMIRRERRVKKAVIMNEIEERVPLGASIYSHIKEHT